MSRLDARGCRVTGASAAGLRAFEHALALFQDWRCGAEAVLEPVLQEAPDFAMARVLQAYLLLCSRDPRRVRSAVPVLARTAGLPATRRERLHIAAIAAVLADDYDSAKAILGEILRHEPVDLLALQVAHVFDYLTGDPLGMKARLDAVLPAWSDDRPGRHAVLAMHAFALEECGDLAGAERTAQAALALEPADARAHHVMAHVFEMTRRPAAGLRWMSDHLDVWSEGTVVAAHIWWHVALFHLAQDDLDGALALYDRRLAATGDNDIAVLIDASALLWRIHLLGGATGTRWSALAAAWSSHVDDAFCTFTDLHAMLAFVGAADWALAHRLEGILRRGQSLPTRHGATTRLIGLPACRALMAFGEGNDRLAITLMASLPPIAHRIGGSHAQRDVLHLTMRHAIERAGRSMAVGVA